MTESDLYAIGQIAEATDLFPADMLGDMVAAYLNASAADIWLTADDASAGPVAFAFCEPERLTNGTWNLLALGVRPDAQSLGIGAKLVQHLESILREAGHRILLVETQGTPQFAKTRNFYHANGFMEEARIREFYDVGGDKVIFWKRL